MTDDRRDDAPFPPPHDPEAGMPPPPPSPPPGPAAEDLLPPWEDRAAHGYAGGFLESIRRTMTAPTRMFRGMAVRRGLWGPLTFYVLLYVLMSVVERIYSLAFSGLTMGMLSWLEELERNDAVDMAVMHFLETIGVFLSPVFALVSVFLITALTHLGALLIIPGQRGFEATFRAVAYGGAPMVLGLIPMCGGFLVAPWTLVAVIVGVRETHRTSTGRAVAAVVVPAVAAFCGCLVTAVIFSWFTAAALGS